MTNFRESVGQLLIDGVKVGTAWLISSEVAITAFHCIETVKEDSSVLIQFPAQRIGCYIDDKVEELDVAILKLSDSHHLSPLQAIARPLGSLSSVEWHGHGYPDGLNTYAASNEGLSLNGRIDNLLASVNDISSIQLTCEQGANIRPVRGGSVLGGVSGSPVLVKVHNEEYVVGFIREQPPAFGERVLFATAIDQLEILHSQALPVRLSSWDSARGIPTIKKLEGGKFQSNIDANLVKQVWESGLTAFWCNMRPDEFPVLANAVERILIHARCIVTRPNAEVTVSGCRAWEATCRKYLKDWVPLSNSSHLDHFRRLKFTECEQGTEPKGGAIFASASELAEHIQCVCNSWVLDELRDKLVEILADPESLINLSIASDVLVVMKQLWKQWFLELQSDKCLLHHFLGLMQTGDGNCDMSQSGAGVGPLTLDRCVSGPIAYTLALCAGLPPELQLPKAARPGNVGVEGLDGHACGIELLKGRTLNSLGRPHQWHTAVVMLPFLQGEWPAFSDAHQRLDVSITGRSQSLAKEPPAAVVLPRDGELQAAIESGLPQLRKVLEGRCKKLVQEQINYVDKASDVQA